MVCLSHLWRYCAIWALPLGAPSGRCSRRRSLGVLAPRVRRRVIWSFDWARLHKSYALAADLHRCRQENCPPALDLPLLPHPLLLSPIQGANASRQGRPRGGACVCQRLAGLGSLRNRCSSWPFSVRSKGKSAKRETVTA